MYGIIFKENIDIRSNAPPANILNIPNIPAACELANWNNTEELILGSGMYVPNLNKTNRARVKRTLSLKSEVLEYKVLCA